MKRITPRADDRIATTPETAPEAKVVTMRLDELREHPLQAVFNPPCTPEEDAALAADIAQGQRDPIHVMPPGNTAGLPALTVLDGHRRRAALLANGATHARVIVRGDLQHASAEEIERLYLGFNCNRRHYDPLAMAASLVRQYELDHPGQRGNMHDVAQRLASLNNHMSLRNVQRYIHAAGTPLEVQQALRSGHITLVMTARIAGLPQEVQDEIARRLASALDAKTARRIVDAHLCRRANDAARPRYATPVVIKMVTTLARELPRLRELAPRVYAPDLVQHIDVLTQAQTLLAELLAIAERGKTQQPASEALAALLGDADTMSPSSDDSI